MKFYNIRQSKDFFERLSECEGVVNIINDDGYAAEFTGNRKDIPDQGLGCFDGSIRQIELKFQKTEDLDKMFRFIMNERRSA